MDRDANTGRRMWIAGAAAVAVLLTPASAGLDRPVPQVLIDATVLSVQQTDLAELGFAGLHKNDRLEGDVRSFFEGSIDNAIQLNTATIDQLLADDAVLNSPIGEPAMNHLQLADSQFSVVLRALEQNAKVKVLQRPVVTALNHQVATITVLQQRPFMLAEGGRRLRKGAQRYRNALHGAMENLAPAGFFDYGAFLVTFDKTGGRNFLETQGLDSFGDLRLTSARSRGQPYLRIRGSGNETVSGFVSTPEFPAEDRDVFLAATMGIHKKPTGKRLANLAGSALAMELDLAPNAESFVIAGVQYAADGSVQGYVQNETGTLAIIKLPPVQVNRTITTIIMSDRETAVIGGIYRTTENAQREFVPWLSDIPIVSSLFKGGAGGVNFKKKGDAGVSEFLIFVTPRIIRSE